MDNRDDYFDMKSIDEDEFENYIKNVTKDLKFD